MELQQKHMKDGDPRYLEGDEMADFMRWNAFALTDEIHEAMQEIGWKPWASSRHINHEAFISEMVDGFHFFMNMLLCGCQGWSPEQIADEFTRRYIEKNAVNAQRQQEGYTGLEKCRQCGRDMKEQLKFGAYRNTAHPDEIFCSKVCSEDYAIVKTVKNMTSSRKRKEST